MLFLSVSSIRSSALISTLSDWEDCTGPLPLGSKNGKGKVNSANKVCILAAAQKRKGKEGIVRT